jgi:DNA-binding NarL/FixJ family response regulator
MKKLTLFLVDDHQLFREGLKFLLSAIPAVGEVYEASNGGEFLKALETVIPDVVFMDIEMPVDRWDKSNYRSHTQISRAQRGSP